MILWGTTIDPSKAQKYEVPIEDTLLPPSPHSTTMTPTPTTRIHSKPTDHLPESHGSTEGEATKPAFGTRPSGSSTPTPDEGWFSDMSNLVSSRKWFFGAVALVVMFGIGAAVFFWRRRRSQTRRPEYASIPAGDDLPMSTITRDGRPAPGGPRTKELYDAFGEVSDDEDVDEETALRGDHLHGRSQGELSFHAGFLDDEDTPAATVPPSKYRDEPEGESGLQSAVAGPSGANVDHPGSPASVSGDGSWEHAP
jgi:kexin